MVGAHDASVRLGHGGLSTERGRLGLWRSRGQRQERLAAAGAEVWQGELGAGQGDGHLERDGDTRKRNEDLAESRLLQEERVQ